VLRFNGGSGTAFDGHQHRRRLPAVSLTPKWNAGVPLLAYISSINEEEYGRLAREATGFRTRHRPASGLERVFESPCVLSGAVSSLEVNAAGEVQLALLGGDQAARSGKDSQSQPGS